MTVTIQSSSYSATIIHTFPTSGPEDENVDVHVTLNNGAVYAGVLASLRNIHHLLDKYSRTGECASGKYVWVSSLVILRDFELDTIRASLDDLVQSGEIQHIFTTQDQSD
ncbi:MAG: hypothetical protein JJU33_11995 [Phycisphaerales bacterium]|nr:hypothetical protein [Phycisphaerales bacterium]